MTQEMVAVEHNIASIDDFSLKGVLACNVSQDTGFVVPQVAHQVGGGYATQPPSTQNGGNDEFNEQWRKSSQLIDEVFGSDELLRNTFLHLLGVPRPSDAESPWQNEEYIAFPSRRSVPGENSPFSARTGLITTSSRGIRHLGCATREKTRIQPKIRNRREAESKEDARFTGHADTSATISGRFLEPESDIERPSTLTGDLGPQSDLNVHPFHPPDRKPTKQVVMEATVPNLSTPDPSTVVSNSLFPLSGPSSSSLLDHIFLLGQPLSSVPHHSKASSPILDCTIDPWFYGPDIFFESQSQGNLDATVPLSTRSLDHEGSRRPSSAATTTSSLDGPAEPGNNDQEFVSEESAMSIEDLLDNSLWLAQGEESSR